MGKGGVVACHPTSIVGPNVIFEGSAFVGPNCILGRPGFQHREWSSEKFAEDGRRTTLIGSGARILGNVVICEGASIGIEVRMDYHCLIGEDAELGDDVTVEYGARIYDRARIGARSTISGFICNDARVGLGSVVQGSLVHARTAPGFEPAPHIEDNCLIGMGAVVIGGVTVRSETVVGAGAVVTSDTEGGYLYLGVPARKVKRQRWY